MITSLIIGLIIAGAMSVVTIQALRSAPDGYEDESGFHARDASETAGSHAGGRMSDHGDSTDDFPPFAAAR
ncbi:hypothetical protein [Horticoccus sp. 23ND18S-11]|uniref:hypothetical protein n=1 Tax=Horticoccus sp. 23ND18S-11 TaxID=3391832 RepID=UPI0039C9B2F0